MQEPWKNEGNWRCPECRSTKLTKDGLIKNKQRYLCSHCGFHTLRPKGSGIKRQDSAYAYKTMRKDRKVQKSKDKRG